MQPSRRQLHMLLPFLAATAAKGQEAVIPSHAFRFEDLPVKQNGENRSRNVFSGTTHGGFHVDLHITELGPRQAPHPPHHHEHEEMVMVQLGALAVTINGVTTKLGPGSVAYVASNEEHGWRNAGEGPAQYFVLALGKPA